MEILIAYAIAISAITSLALLIFNGPIFLESLRLKREAYSLTDTLLRTYDNSFSLASGTASTSLGIYESSIDIIPVVGNLAAKVSVTTTWKNAQNEIVSVRIPEVFTNLKAATELSCNPFPLGDWEKAYMAETYLPRNLAPSEAMEPYPLSGIAVSPQELILSVATTLLPSSPTLLLFDLGDESLPPELSRGFDNAPTSRTGFSAVATSGEYLFAANAFGSASAASCVGGSCAQVHIFRLRPEPSVVSSLQLSTSSLPHAVTTSGISAAAQSIAYHDGYLYLGLVKTDGGYEFNIIDIHEPTHPFWVGGVPIGRSVNAITLEDGRAYLGTSDPARELIVISIKDPAHPQILGSWNAPGANGFGLGAAVSVNAHTTLFGRSYVANAAELYVLDTSDPTEIKIIEEQDLGTPKLPQSIRSIVTRSYLHFIVTNKRVITIDSTYSPINEIEIGNIVGAVCRADSLYIASLSESDDGRITVYSSP